MKVPGRYLPIHLEKPCSKDKRSTKKNNNELQKRMLESLVVSPNQGAEIVVVPYE